MASTLTHARNGPASDETGPIRSLELDALFRRYHSVLCRLCARWTRGHHADAQDLLAEAYLRAVRATAQNTVLPDNPIAWVSGIIANLARDRLRARSRTGRLLDDGAQKLETLCDPAGSSDALYATRELLSKTLDQVRSLCPMQRNVLLARSAGEEYEAIAAHFGTSPSNARKLVQTARRQLRAGLSAE